MEDTLINDIYDRISKIIKNDQKYTHQKMGKLVIACLTSVAVAESLYANYPPLLDISELGAALEYEGSSHQESILQQMHYKMTELKALLPDIR